MLNTSMLRGSAESEAWKRVRSPCSRKPARKPHWINRFFVQMPETAKSKLCRDRTMNHGIEPACNSGRLHPAVDAYAESLVWSRAGDLLRLASFRPALHAYCRTMMQPPEMAWPADKFFGQKLRYLVSYALIGQDARWRRSEGELPTLSSLQRAAHASARQVSNLVASLKLGGYVVAIRSSHDRRADARRAVVAGDQ